MSTSTGAAVRSTPAAAPASRALLAAALAAVVTFSRDNTAPFGLAVLGIFLVAQGLLTAAWSARLARTRTGLGLLLARSAVSVVAGVAALTSTGGGVDALRLVEIAAFLVVGVLEVLGALLRAEGPDTAGDALVVGGLQVVVGLMLVILNPDQRFSVGVLSAWGAIVAVYLGIAAANLRALRRRA